MNLNDWSEKTESLSLQYRIAQTRFREARQSLMEAEERLKNIEKAQNIVQFVAQNLQEEAHAALSAVVSRCLSAVFESPYEFKILFEQKRGRTEAVMVFERDGIQVDPMTASGGGVVDLAAFALRLACLMLRTPACRRILVMDEPFKSPSPHYRERVKDLLETLAAEMDVQFIIVTNIMELVTGNVIDLETMEKPAATRGESGAGAKRRARLKG